MLVSYNIKERRYKIYPTIYILPFSYFVNNYLNFLQELIKGSTPEAKEIKYKKLYNK